MMETLDLLPTSPIKYEDVLLAEDPRDEHSQPFLPEVTLYTLYYALYTLFKIVCTPNQIY